MYIVTFYSFKGGVGRSMSLVNVGVQLAQLGRRVLLVDFDLEAPGLPTFSLKRPAEDVQGVVEYVSQYIATGESPDVMNYVYESESFPSGGGLWMMPAGNQDVSYSHRLNSIDWQKLYLEQDGYLFLEDLKRQWEDRIAPDYVLIDSRTGHSDVEGVCTRQLPNAVCLLFFPNEQNLHGLKRIVANINASNESLNKKIAMHFAVSNVPDLDDEDQILGMTLKKFKCELGYKELAAEIHHYNSLSLLNQEIFSIARPNSRLTKEYKVLAKAITKYNFGDREVAIAFLRSAHLDLGDVMDDEDPLVLAGKIDTILKNFPNDGEIDFYVALVFELLGNSHDALSMLHSDAIKSQYANARMFATRARLNHRLGIREDALNDLSLMLDADGADIGSFLEVVPLIDQLDAELYEKIPSSRALKSLPAKDQMFIAFQLDGNRKQLKANLAIIQRLRRNPFDDGDFPPGYLDHELVLALIGTGDCNAAVEAIESAHRDKEIDVSDSFNLAMAKWGRDGAPALDLFDNVTKLDAGTPLYADRSANYMQCLAISHAVLGNVEEAGFFLAEAKEKIKSGGGRIFSAWSYLKVPVRKFLLDIEEIEKLISGEDILPRFIVEKK